MTVSTLCWFDIACCVDGFADGFHPCQQSGWHQSAVRNHAPAPNPPRPLLPPLPHPHFANHTAKTTEDEHQKTSISTNELMSMLVLSLW